MVLAKIVMLVTLGIIVVQDLTKYEIWWFVFPIYMLLGGYFYLSTTFLEIYVTIVGINAIILLSFFVILYTYTRFILKKKFLNGVFGLGDVLLYVGLMVSFPTITFIILLVVLPLFALTLHYFLRNKKNKYTPYAGYSSIFLSVVYLVHWAGFYNTLYVL